MSATRPEVESSPDASAGLPIDAQLNALSATIQDTQTSSTGTDVPSAYIAKPQISASAASRSYMAWFERVTGIVGVALLVAGLAVWRFKPGDHRAALILLVCAMFLAILHYYSLEER